MKPTILLALLLPFVTIAQKIKFNGYDKFLKQKVIETVPVTLKNGENAASLTMKAVGSNFYISIKGYGAGASTIGSEDQAILLLDNDSTVVIRSVGVQTYEVRDERSMYKHEYAISLAGLEYLSKYNLVGIRKYAFRNFVDLNIPEKNREEPKKMSALLLHELASSKVIYNKQITLEEVNKNIGDSISVCGLIFTAKYMQNSENKPVLLNMGAPYPNQLLTLVIYEEDRNQFAQAPEVLFKDKDVCVTGRILMYNNRPQIVIRKASQIQIRGQMQITPVTTVKTF